MICHRFDELDSQLAHSALIPTRAKKLLLLGDLIRFVHPFVVQIPLMRVAHASLVDVLLSRVRRENADDVAHGFSNMVRREQIEMLVVRKETDATVVSISPALVTSFGPGASLVWAA